MSVISTTEVKAFLKKIEGKEISLNAIRKEFNIVSGTKSYDAVRNIMFQLAESRVVRPVGKREGIYKVVTQVYPVPIFSVQRERRNPFDLGFPIDFDTHIPMDFSEDVVVREGDLILIAGVSNFGKTTLALQFLAANINLNPVLMGNEYTNPLGEPMPRFLNRLDVMDVKNGGWVEWVDDNGNDKFTLLPVHDDFAEHIVKDRINIVDWINIESGEHFLIGNLLQSIKKHLGRGIGIAVIQKGEGADAGRGGQFTKDFADLEILIDKFGKYDTLLKLGKVKESHKPISGKTYGFGIGDGVKIINFREVKPCTSCHGNGYTKSGQCEVCIGKKYVDMETPF